MLASGAAAAKLRIKGRSGFAGMELPAAAEEAGKAAAVPASQ